MCKCSFKPLLSIGDIDPWCFNAGFEFFKTLKSSELINPDCAFMISIVFRHGQSVTWVST